MSPENNDESMTLDGETVLRRPYEGPAVIDSATFETLALMCAKVSPTFACMIGGPSDS